MRASPASRRTSSVMAFTIIEMLVATAVFMLMVVLLVSAVSQINTAWQYTDGQKSSRQSARALLDLIARDLQAALGPLDRYNASELHFDKTPGGAPTSPMDSLFWNCSSPSKRSGSDIITVGYFVRQTSTESILCRIQQPGVVKQIWLQADILAPAIAPEFRGLAAEGVLAMFVTLYRENGTVLTEPGLEYTDSELPHAAEVALIIADPRTLKRLFARGSLPSLRNPDEYINSIPADFRAGVQLYRTRVDLPSAR